MRNLNIVGDFTHEKPFMVVEIYHGKNGFFGHKIIDRFKTKKEAKELKDVLNEDGEK